MKYKHKLRTEGKGSQSLKNNSGEMFEIVNHNTACLSFFKELTKHMEINLVNLNVLSVS